MYNRQYIYNYLACGEGNTYLIFGFALLIIISHSGQYCSVSKCFIRQLWQTATKIEIIIVISALKNTYV